MTINGSDFYFESVVSGFCVQSRDFDSNTFLGLECISRLLARMSLSEFCLRSDLQLDNRTTL